MDVIELARSSGMLVILNGRIGREEYRVVYGSTEALQRFADALISFREAEVPRPQDMVLATGNQTASTCL